MSATSIKKVICPHCGHKENVTVNGSINLMLDAHLIEPLLSGKLFEHKCSKCNKNIRQEHAILVNDSFHSPARFIWFKPIKPEEDFMTQQKSMEVNISLSENIIKGFLGSMCATMSMPINYTFYSFDEFKMAVDACLNCKEINQSKIHMLANLPTDIKTITMEEVENLGK